MHLVEPIVTTRKIFLLPGLVRFLTVEDGHLDSFCGQERPSGSWESSATRAALNGLQDGFRAAAVPALLHCVHQRLERVRFTRA